jgi:hypothetical protein
MSAVAIAPDLQADLDDQRLERIVELADLAASLWTSVSEAAWRGERRTLQAHLSQARVVTIDAIALAKALGRDADADQ